MADIPSSFLPKLSTALTTIDEPALSSALQHLRTWSSGSNRDGFELDYSKTWLKRLLKNTQSEHLLDEAAQCLADLDVPQDTSASRRSLKFQTPSREVSINLTETSMQDVDATGFCTWSSAVVLSNYILSNPHSMLPSFSAHLAKAERPLKVLELGSGTGLAGIAAIWALYEVNIPASIVLTDYDERTLRTLAHNLAVNIPEGLRDQVWSIRKLAWEAVADFPERDFDIIVGADIIYEPFHGKLVYQAVDALLSYGGIFHLVIPIRYTHAADVAALEDLFSIDNAQGKPSIQQILNFEQSDVGQYPHRYYRIGRR